MQKKLINIEIPGSFGSQNNQAILFKVENNNKLIINIHGVYGSLRGGNDKYFNFAKKFQKNKIASVVLYQSSRNKPRKKEIDIISNENIDYFERQSILFKGKKFSDELKDSREIIKHFIDNCEKYFGFNKEDLEITLNGNSLGGILAIILTFEFKQIKNICSIGTGLYLNLKNLNRLPILNSIPSRLELKKYLNKYKNNFLFNYGTDDKIFTKQSFDDFYSNLIKANKKLIVFKKVDHSFGKLKGEISQKPYNQIFKNLKEII